MAMTHFPDCAGGYAELAVVDAAQVARISPDTSFAEVAATLLADGPLRRFWPGSRCG